MFTAFENVPCHKIGLSIFQFTDVHKCKFLIVVKTHDVRSY